MFSKKYEKVFLIAGNSIFKTSKQGNHEFYGNEYFSTKEQIKRVCSKFENVTFMDKNSEKYCNIRFEIRLLNSLISWMHLVVRCSVGIPKRR
jgi:hypothetical protein